VVFKSELRIGIIQIFFSKSLDPDLELIISDSDSDPTAKGSKLCNALCNCCSSFLKIKYYTVPTIKINFGCIFQEGYSCQCPPGLTGAICSVNVTTCQHRKCSVVNPIQFAGRSYAQYTLKRSVERHLSLSLGFRTLYSVATLVYAQGLVDYSILEIVEGRLQYRFNFGSGEGLVRLNEKVVNDGEWHEVKMERHGNSAEIAVNGKWRAHGAAPGLNDVLNLEQSDVYFGAEVVATDNVSSSVADFSAAGGGGNVAVSRGFVGCMDDIQVDHVPLPLHLQGDSTVARLRRFANIEFKCGELAPAGPCGHHPCQNGGTCLEVGEAPGGHACACAARFSGASCEFDLDPCASGPCLHGAKCVNLKNDFHCECPTKLSGKRCHYGRYCNPNPCLNGGLCEEGLSGPICKCRGYTGELCTIDVNECLHQNPCHNGGTCVNSPGGFHCICSGTVYIMGRIPYTAVCKGGGGRGARREMQRGQLHESAESCAPI
jgi:protocadherin Fat 1/2/3